MKAYAGKYESGTTSGQSSIMYDCSADSYDENVKKVKEMVDIAHSYGATIEGELGYVGDNEGSAEGISKVNIFTDINVAAVEAEFKKIEYMSKGIIDLIPAAVEAVKQETIKKIHR